MISNFRNNLLFEFNYWYKNNVYLEIFKLIKIDFFYGICFYIFINIILLGKLFNLFIGYFKYLSSLIYKG